MATATTLQKLQNRADWADEDELDDGPAALPAPVTTTNKDGTRTIISFSLNEQGQKVKSTRRVRTIVTRETVNPRVAERRGWAKFGDEKGKGPGPSHDTTTVGENIIFRPSVTWKRDAKSGGGGGGDADDKKKEEENLKDKLKDKKVRCRICEGEHFTARCPFKDSMPAPGEGSAAAGGGLGLDDDDGAGAGAGKAEGGLGTGGSSYVPPHMRKGGAGAGEKMAGGKYEKDDLATLRVTNVSEDAEEGELRAIFERFGRVVRVYLAKDRETGRAKGFAFISYADRSDAAKAAEKADGYGYNNLILRVEFAKRAT